MQKSCELVKQENKGINSSEVAAKIMLVKIFPFQGKFFLHRKPGMVQPSFAFEFPFIWDMKHAFSLIFEDYCFTTTHIDFMCSNNNNQNKPPKPWDFAEDTEAHHTYLSCNAFLWFWRPDKMFSDCQSQIPRTMRQGNKKEKRGKQARKNEKTNMWNIF